MPPIAVARVYRASVEGDDARRRVVPLVVAWWLAYLVPPILTFAVAAPKLVASVSRFAHVSDRVTRVDPPPYFRTASTWALWLLPVSIVAAVLAITLVTNIDRAQERLAVWVPPRPDLL